MVFVDISIASGVISVFDSVFWVVWLVNVFIFVVVIYACVRLPRWLSPLSKSPELGC